MKIYFRKIKQLFSGNIFSLITFEFVSKLIYVAILLPSILGLYKLSQIISGYRYVTQENIFSYVLHPITLLFFILLIIFIALYVIYDGFCLILTFHASHLYHKISPIHIAHLGFIEFKRLFKLKNVLLVFITILFLPIIGLSQIVLTFKIFNFNLYDEATSLFPLWQIRTVFIGFSLVDIIYISYLANIYHYFAIEEQDFFDAFKNSVINLRYKVVKNCLILIVSILMLYVINEIITNLLILISASISKGKDNPNMIYSTAMSLVVSLLLIFYFISLLFSSPILFIHFSFIYYDNNEGDMFVKILDKKSISNSKLKAYKISFLTLSVLSIGALFIYGILIIHNNIKLNLGSETIDVTSHRGANYLAPENTLEAFELAMEDDPDYLEFDVRQTKDKKLVIMHDESALRTTGVDKKISSMTLEEVKQLDCGSTFNKDFGICRVPTFEEALELAISYNQRLNIEIKSSRYDLYIEQQIYDIVLEHGYLSKCVFACTKYDVLKNFKSIDSNVKTVYITSLAINDVTSLSLADVFEVRYASITSDLVSKIHKKGKKIFAWTCNEGQIIQKMIQLGVDNIITDDIGLAFDYVYETYTTTKINLFVKKILDIF